MPFSPTVISPVVAGNTATLSSGSFTPAAGGLVIVSGSITAGTVAAMGAISISSTHAGQGNWTVIQSPVTTFNQTSTFIAYSVAGPTPGAGTVTVTFAGTPADARFVVEQIDSGFNVSNPAVGAATATGGTTATTPSVAMSAFPAAGSLVYGAFSARNLSTAPSAGPTFTQLTSSTGAANPRAALLTEWKNASQGTDFHSVFEGGGGQSCSGWSDTLQNSIVIGTDTGGVRYSADKTVNSRINLLGVVGLGAKKADGVELRTINGVQVGFETCGDGTAGVGGLYLTYDANNTASRIRLDGSADNGISGAPQLRFNGGNNNSALLPQGPREWNGTKFIDPQYPRHYGGALKVDTVSLSGFTLVHVATVTNGAWRFKLQNSLIGTATNPVVEQTQYPNTSGKYIRSIGYLGSMARLLISTYNSSAPTRPYLCTNANVSTGSSLATAVASTTPTNVENADYVIAPGTGVQPLCVVTQGSNETGTAVGDVLFSTNAHTAAAGAISWTSVARTVAQNDGPETNEWWHGLKCGYEITASGPVHIIVVGTHYGGRQVGANKWNTLWRGTVDATSTTPVADVVWAVPTFNEQIMNRAGVDWQWWNAGTGTPTLNGTAACSAFAWHPAYPNQWSATCKGITFLSDDYGRNWYPSAISGSADHNGLAFDQWGSDVRKNRLGSTTGDWPLAASVAVPPTRMFDVEGNAVLRWTKSVSNVLWVDSRTGDFFVAGYDGTGHSVPDADPLNMLGSIPGADLVNTYNDGSGTTDWPLPNDTTTSNTVTVTKKQLASNVATLTAAAHGFTVGTSVVVSGVDATFNGTYTVTSVTASTFSYAKTASNVSLTTASGSAVGTIPSVAAIMCGTIGYSTGGTVADGALMVAKRNGLGLQWRPKSAATWAQITSPSGAPNPWDNPQLGSMESGIALMDLTRGQTYWFERQSGTVWRVPLTGNNVPGTARRIFTNNFSYAMSRDGAGWIDLDEANDRLWICTINGVWYINNVSTTAHVATATSTALDNNIGTATAIPFNTYYPGEIPGVIFYRPVDGSVFLKTHYLKTGTTPVYPVADGTDGPRDLVVSNPTVGSNWNPAGANVIDWSVTVDRGARLGLIYPKTAARNWDGSIITYSQQGSGLWAWRSSGDPNVTAQGLGTVYNSAAAMNVQPAGTSTGPTSIVVTGVGTPSASGSTRFVTATTITGEGTPTANGTVSTVVSATVTGEGTPSATVARVSTGGTATVSGVGTPSANGSVVASRNATVTGVGTPSANGSLLTGDSGLVTGVGTVSATGLPTVIGVPPIGVVLRLLIGGQQYFLPDYQSIELGFDLADVGALSMDYSKFGVNADKIAEDGIVIAYDAFTGAELIDGRWVIQAAEGGAYTDDAPVVSWVGKSYMDALRRIMVLPTVINPQDTVKFDASTAGGVLTNLLTAASLRGAMVGLSWDFTSAKDSNGAPWNTKFSIEYRVGVPYLDIVRNMVDQGYAELRWNKGVLQAFNSGTMGSDLSTGSTIVELVAGRDYTETPFRRTAEERTNFVMVTGDDGLMVPRTSSTPNGPFGREETAISQGGVKDIGTLALVGDAALAKNVLRQEYTREVAITPGRPLPGFQYNVGDYLLDRVDTAAVRYRVRTLVLKSDSNGLVSASVTLNDKLLEQEIRLARRVSGILGGATVDGGGNGLPSDTIDKTIPAAPTGLLLNATSYTDNDGAFRYVVTVDWNAPILNTDGSNLTDLAGYEILWNYGTSLAAKPFVQAVTDSFGVLDSLTAGQPITVSVRAKDNSGHVSAQHPPATLALPIDQTPPAKPSTPTVVDFLGSLVVGWDGLDSTGQPMPKDFAGVRVHVSTQAGFTPSVSNLSTTMLYGPNKVVVSGLTYGLTYYVRLVAFDRANNPSPASDQASGIPRKVTGGDQQPTATSSGKVDLDVSQFGASSVWYGPSSPVSPTQDDLWLQNDPQTLQRWDGAKWVLFDSNKASALLGSLASAAVFAPDGRTRVYYQTVAPSVEGDGDVWVNTAAGYTAQQRYAPLGPNPRTNQILNPKITAAGALATIRTNELVNPGWELPSMIRRNLVGNPGFETSTDGWIPANCTLTRGTVGTGSPQSGTGYGRMVANGGANPAVAYTGIPVIPGRSLTGSFYTNTATPMHVFFRFLDKNGSILLDSPGSPSFYVSGIWTRAAQTITVPTGATSLQLFVRATNTPANGAVINVDSVLLEYSAGLGSYFDAATDPAMAIRTNLVPNPSFEYDTNDWICTAGTFQRIAMTGGPNAGNYVARLTTAGQTAFFSTMQAINVGTAYTGSMYIYSSAPATAYVAVQFFGADGSTLVQETTSTTADLPQGNYGRLSVTATAPTGAVYARIAMRCPTAPVNGTFIYIDGVLLEDSSIVNDYFDGDTVADPNGWVHLWQGKTSASPSVLAAQQWLSAPFVANPAVPVRGGYATNTTTIQLMTKAPIGPLTKIAAPLDSTAAPVVPATGSVWSGRVKLRQVGTPGGDVIVQARLMTDTGVILANSGDITLLASGDVVDASIGSVASFPAGAASVQLQLWTGSSGTWPAGVNITAVDAMIENGSSPALFFQGDTLAADGVTYAWNGTPYASTSKAVAAAPANWTAGPDAYAWIGSDGSTRVRARRTNTSGAYLQSTLVPIVATQVASFSARVNSARSGATAQAVLTTYNSSMAQLGQQVSTAQDVSIGSTLVKTEAKVAETGAAFANARVLLNLTNTTYTVSNGLFELAANVGDYFDGDSLGSSWAGTPGASVSSYSPSWRALGSSTSDLIAGVAGAAAAYDGLVFSTAPTPHINPAVGDLWFNTTTLALSRWSGSVWIAIDSVGLIASILATAGTQTAFVDAILAGLSASMLDRPASTVAYQTSAPIATGVGDYWVNGLSVSRWSGESWVAVTDAATVAGLTNTWAQSASSSTGTIDIFTQASPPISGASLRDLWIDTDENNRAYWRFNNTWQPVPYGIGGTAVGSIGQTSLTGDIRAALGQVFYEDFSDVSRWKPAPGSSYTGTIVSRASADTRAGGSIGRISGAASLVHTSVYPLDGSELYRVTVRARNNPDYAGSMFYAGIVGVQADGVNFASSTATGAYLNVAASGVDPTGVWTDYVGYFSASSGTPTNVAHPDPKNPMALDSSVKYYRAFVQANVENSGSTGTTELDMFKVEAVPTGLVSRLNIQVAAINSALIEDLAVISAKIADLAVTNAKIANLAVDDAKIANLSAAKILTGVLQADAEIIAGDPNGNHVRLTGTGMRVYGPDTDGDGIAEEVIRLGTADRDFFAIVDESGTSVASVDEDGAASFSSLDVAGDATMLGRPLLGRFAAEMSDLVAVTVDDPARDETTDPISFLEVMPRGVVMSHVITYPELPTLLGAAEIGLIELDFNSIPYRHYTLETNWLSAFVSSAGTVALRARVTEDGTPPVVSSPIWDEYNLKIVTGSTGSAKLRLGGRLINGSGNDMRILISLYTDGTPVTFNGTGTLGAFYVSIMDHGKTKARSGVLSTGNGSRGTSGSTTPPTPPPASPPAPPTRKTYVKTYTSTSSATYRGTTGAPRRTDTSSVYQGRYSSTNEDQRGIWIFPNMTADLAGATVTRVEAYLYADAWYNNSGGTARIGVHGHTSAPGANPGIATVVDSGGWPKPGGRWVTLPGSTYAGFQNGTWRGVGVGPAGSGNLGYYGTFRGGAGAQIRITYVK